MNVQVKNLLGWKYGSRNFVSRHDKCQFFAKFAANLANYAETKSWYGEGTELVRSGSSYDVLWRRFGKSKVVHDGKGYC